LDERKPSVGARSGSMDDGASDETIVCNPFQFGPRACKYGASCYNWSSYHRATYSHPDVPEPSTDPDSDEDAESSAHLDEDEERAAAEAAAAEAAKRAAAAAARWQISNTSAWPRTWKYLPAEESAAVEEGFNACDGKGSHKTSTCSYSFDRWTALEFGKQRVMALRRLQDASSGVVTHPAGYGTPKMIDDQGKFSEIHPYDFYQMRRRQPDPASGDWASNDFFFNCFLSALRSLRQDTREYEKPGKMHEWFDFRANFDWRGQTQVKTHTRGGLRYIEPNGFYGFAVNVLGKYDGGNNDWMKLEGNPGEWAVAYHGTKVSGFPAILTSGFRAGGGQAHKNGTCVKTGAPIGTGVYCTPSLAVAERYGGEGHDFNGRKIIFVMQCRVNPAKIKHCHDYDTNGQAYWVLNDPKDIRPYRVLIKAV